MCNPQNGLKINFGGIFAEKKNQSKCNDFIKLNTPRISYVSANWALAMLCSGAVNNNYWGENTAVAY